MSSEASPWQDIQYSGDANDIRALLEEYNVAGFLQARSAGERANGQSFRAKLMKDGVLLTATLSPRIYGIVKNVQETLRIDGEFDVFCVKDTNVNAFAYLGEVRGEPERIVALTSGALEQLADQEIAFLLGHELGHFIFGHNELLGLLNQDEDSKAITVLPHLGECLFLRWRKKGEVSADRLGLIAAGAFEPSAKALVKAGFGLSERNLNLDIDMLLAQIEKIKDTPEAIEATFRSHPLMPLRLKALHAFSGALEGAQQGRVMADSFNQANGSIDQLFSWFKRYPRKPVPEAVMRIIALAGMQIISGDEELDDEEIRSIIYVLHSWFTDDPEKELILDPAEREKRWNEAVALINREGDVHDKQFIICRLADIAMADGKLLTAEGSKILEVAKALGLAERDAYGIIVGAAQTVGFKVDYKMKGLIKQVRSQLVDGG